MNIIVIAINTFKEAIRDKILYNLLFFALLLISLSLLFATLTVGDRSKIIIDLGLASINVFGLLISVFLGIGLISKEIEKRTIFTIIAKPVPRYQFLAGKYIGLLITVTVNTIIMGIGLYLALMLNEYLWGHGVRNVNVDIWKAIYLILIEFMVMTAIAILFSTFSSSSTLSAIFTLAAYVVGHLTEDIKLLGDKAANIPTKTVTNFIYYLLPNLDNFNIKGRVVYGLHIPLSYITFVTIYGLLYIACLLLLAGIIFQKRDFK
ncbi:MAG: ABC transporter permease subunit [Nitrospirae bacterium]|nr:ABC transporter permease subunit [Nitrospirota bacterium]